MDAGHPALRAAQLEDRRIGHRRDRLTERSRHGPIGGHRGPAGLDVARVDQHHDQRQPTVVLDGHEGHGRRAHQHRDGRQLLGCACRDRHVAAQDVAGPGQDEGAAQDRPDRMRPVLQARRDAEVATPAANCPEQVGVLVGAGPHQHPVGRHDLDGQEVIDGKSVLTGQPADAAAEREAPESHGGRVPEGRRLAVGERRPDVLAREDAALGGRDPALRVDGNRLHRGQVDHQCPVGHADAVTGDAVPAPANGKGETRLAREGDGRGHLARIQRPRDRGRPAVDPGIGHLAGNVVPGIARDDHAAAQARGEGGELGCSSRGWVPRRPWVLHLDVEEGCIVRCILRPRNRRMHGSTHRRLSMSVRRRVRGGRAATRPTRAADRAATDQAWASVSRTRPR